MHVITRTKHGISSMELSRQLGVSVNAAWRIQHKLMQVMHERERDGEHKLGDRGGRIQMDDAYLGGERNGGKRGRGAAGKTPFIAAVETDDEGRPQRALLQRVVGFRKAEVEKLRIRAILPGCEVVSDGLSCFDALPAPGQVTHVAIKTGGGRKSAQREEFFWVNTVLANVKNNVLGMYRSVRPKHVPRYLAQFQWRFNRRFDLKNIHRRLAYAAARTPPMPHRLLKLPENRWG
jgi:transposase-like protein